VFVEWARTVTFAAESISGIAGDVDGWEQDPTRRHLRNLSELLYGLADRITTEGARIAAGQESDPAYLRWLKSAGSGLGAMGLTVLSGGAGGVAGVVATTQLADPAPAAVVECVDFHEDLDLDEVVRAAVDEIEQRRVDVSGSADSASSAAGDLTVEAELASAIATANDATVTTEDGEARPDPVRPDTQVEADATEEAAQPRSRPFTLGSSTLGGPDTLGGGTAAPETLVEGEFRDEAAAEDSVTFEVEPGPSAEEVAEKEEGISDSTAPETLSDAQSIGTAAQLLLGDPQVVEWMERSGRAKSNRLRRFVHQQLEEWREGGQLSIAQSDVAPLAQQVLTKFGNQSSS